jgi:three-Cys-motif partner protein
LLSPLCRQAAFASWIQNINNISRQKCSITKAVGSQRDNLVAEDDGLVCPEVRSWAEDKYRLIALYDALFSTGMKHKWNQRVYVDLYAGAGISRIEGTSAFLKGSPLIALTVPDPFDKYIFCEEDEALLSALKARVQRMAPQANVQYIAGSCDAKIDEICSHIPKASPTNKVLSLCMVDPFDFGLKFSTLRRLSNFYIDFLVLLAVGMDANRNYDHYVTGESTKIDEALGNTEWRQRWPGHRRSDFMQFLAAEFSASMKSLKYLEQPLDRMKMVRSNEKNLRLYYLALFSRHETAYKFWDDVLRYGTDQIDLFGD